MPDFSNIGNELGSFAWSLLPAVAGGLTGGPAGAIQGLGAGVGAQERNRLDTARLNTDIAFKNIGVQQHQQQIDLQAGNYERLNKLAEEQIQDLQLGRQKNQLELDTVRRTTAGRAQFRDGLPPEEQRFYDGLDANRQSEYIENKYKDRDWQTKVQNASGTLQKMGLSEDQANLVGPTGLSTIMGQLMTDKPFSMYVDPYSGYTYLLNQRAAPGKEITRLFGGGGRKEEAAGPEKRTAVEKGMLSQWRLMYPNEAKLSEDNGGDLSRYNDWRQSEEGRLYHDNFYQKLTPEQFQDELDTLKKKDSALTSSATAAMKKRYMELNTGEKREGEWRSQFKGTDESFKEYMASDDGAAHLKMWREHLRQPRGKKPWDDDEGQQPQPGRAGPGPRGLNLPPPPALNRDKYTYDTDRKVWLYSDGRTWRPIPGNPPPLRPQGGPGQ